ncbi:MAG TPA: hypothetical protein VF584_14510 [Longimicrobium sp.]
MIQILSSAEAHGQRVPPAQFVPAAIEISSSPALPGGGDFGPSPTPVERTRTGSLYELPADTTARALRRRLRPYAIGGAVVGGLIGYAIMPKSCDVGDNMFCQYTSLGYPFVGLGAGAWAGILVGYLRERQ